MRKSVADLSVRSANCVVRRGDVVTLQELLSETLARFELSRSLRGTKDRETARRELVNHAQLQRKFWANHREVRTNLVRQRQQRIDVLHIRRKALCFIRNAAIS